MSIYHLERQLEYYLENYYNTVDPSSSPAYEDESSNKYRRSLQISTATPYKDIILHYTAIITPDTQLSKMADTYIKQLQQKDYSRNLYDSIPLLDSLVDIQNIKYVYIPTNKDIDDINPHMEYLNSIGITPEHITTKELDIDYPYYLANTIGARNLPNLTVNIETKHTKEIHMDFTPDTALLETYIKAKYKLAFNSTQRIPRLLLN